jgi:5-methylcytosine-specific restriction protein B
VQFFQIEPHLTGDRLNPVSDYRTGDVFVGTWWPWGEAPEGLAMRGEVLERARALLPVLDAAAPTTAPTEPPTEREQGGEDELDAYVARFRNSQPYPSDRDEQHQESRRRFAGALSADNLAVLDLAEFRRIVNSSTAYGGTGPQSVLNASLQGMDSQGLDEFARRLHEILWGHGTVDMRIDRALDWNDLGTKGLGESVLLKMFAIVDPDRFVPVFPLLGPNGKIAMLRRLGLAEPDRDLSLGKRHVIANDILRRRLEPLFPGDPWGQAQFGYWLLQNDVEALSEIDLLGKTAEQLLVAEPFLQEIKELLLEKGQVVFYGPPGTGKTFIAEKFAAAIQPDAERRMTVQFHPSMSYEDFFEGYRPHSDNGQLVYDLRPGPLALLAERAATASGLPHVLIIDELNRANLPRVFGELLYLLEYRNKSVRTAYRGEETFELPENLYVIGTMNTADRSIAMIDAALRRRFHFIPFLPHEGELSGVLKRWLKVNEEPAWVAGLVNEVNEQLKVILRGSHLLIGHSHFMVADAGAGKPTALTEQRLRRIWEYGVYPMIEDQLHGRPEQLAAFTWPAVLDRYGPGSVTAGDADMIAEDDANDA